MLLYTGPKPTCATAALYTLIYLKSSLALSCRSFMLGQLYTLGSTEQPETWPIKRLLWQANKYQTAINGSLSTPALCSQFSWTPFRTSYSYHGNFLDDSLSNGDHVFDTRLTPPLCAFTISYPRTPCNKTIRSLLGWCSGSLLYNEGFSSLCFCLTWKFSKVGRGLDTGIKHFMVGGSHAKSKFSLHAPLAQSSTEKFE
jgi:hypothetical protein